MSQKRKKRTDSIWIGVGDETPMESRLRRRVSGRAISLKDITCMKGGKRCYGNGRTRP